MLRQGRLPTDPEVRAMTPFQWEWMMQAYEYYDMFNNFAEQEKQRDQQQALMTGVIRLLGLDVLNSPPPKDTPEYIEYKERLEASGVPDFTPASFLWAHPQVLSAILDKLKAEGTGAGKDEDATRVPEEEFAVFSANLHDVLAGRSDPSVLGPMADIVKPRDTVAERRARNRELLERMGLKKADPVAIQKAPRYTPGAPTGTSAGAWEAFQQSMLEQPETDGDESP
jgi:hypothetical protein